MQEIQTQADKATKNKHVGKPVCGILGETSQRSPISIKMNIYMEIIVFLIEYWHFAGIFAAPCSLLLLNLSQTPQANYPEKTWMMDAHSV